MSARRTSIEPDRVSEEPMDDPHPFRTDLRAMLGGANLVVLIIAIAGCLGRVRHADRRRRRPPLGHALDRRTRHLRGVVQAIAVAFPGVRQAIDDATAANDDFHYWWSEGLGAQLALVPGAGYVVGMCVPLAVVLIIVMPVISLRAPRIAAEGSHLEKVEPGRRDAATAFVFVGLGATTLGIGLWLFGDGGSIVEFPEGVARLLSAVPFGYVMWDEAVWLIGVVLVVLGVAAMAWGCVRVLIARGRAAAEAPGR